MSSLVVTGAGSPNTTEVELVDTKELLSKSLDAVLALPTSPPSLYIDLEGIDLCRAGTISILQIYAAPLDRVWLIDIHKLQSAAFTPPAKDTGGSTLRNVLESPSTPKVFFDVRNDSDTLFAHFNINLAGTVDLQLMELATRPRGGRRVVSGLAKCIERDAGHGLNELRLWNEKKLKGKQLFAPERGGSYAVFNERPLSDEIRDYCVQDVTLMVQLRKRYSTALTPAWTQRVQAAILARVRESQGVRYNGRGRHMALAPAGWNNID